MSNTERGWCSWCLARGEHKRIEQNWVRRNIYRCRSCGNTTVQCMFCSHFARAGRVWDDNCCAEHDHSVPSFARLNAKIDCLKQYEDLMSYDVPNLAKIGTIVALSVGGATVLGPAALAAAPAIGGAIGTTFFGLSGAAATSAGLASLGGGALAAGGFGIVGGTSVITATGLALGGTGGALVGRAYMNDVQGFDIEKLKGGKGPAVVVVNGFLTQQSDDRTVWRAQLHRLYPKNPWYVVHWESKRLRSLGATIATAGGGGALEAILRRLGKRAAKEGVKKLLPLGTVLAALGLARNDWHVCMTKADQTGTILADALARVRRGNFILIGHSLGARVLYQALVTLSSRQQAIKRARPIVATGHLLGGAVGYSDRAGWAGAAEATRNGVRVYHSQHDWVLSAFYRVFNAFMSDPVGRAGIRPAIPGVRNIDTSAVVRGHGEYKPKLTEIQRSRWRLAQALIRGDVSVAQGKLVRQLIADAEATPLKDPAWAWQS